MYCVHKNNEKTCYKKDTLIKIANEYNKYNSDKININSNNLHNIIKNKFKKYSCNKDECWINITILKDIKDDILENFRPTVPEDWYNNSDKWLNTLDIMNVMKQYEDKYNDFVFLSVSPKDFDTINGDKLCVTEELCKFNLLEHYNNGKRKIGVIFNLDNHYQGGSHWVSMYIDVNKAAIYYVDSVGEYPLNEFKNFMNKVKKQGDELIYNNIIKLNNIENNYSILQSCDKINNNIIKVKNGSLFKVNNIISLSLTQNFNNNNINKLKKIKENYLELEKKITKNYKYILQKSFRIFYSNIQHQRGNNECGMYSINFIDNMLIGIDFFDYVSNKKTDKQMNELRYSKYFLPIDLFK